MSNAEPFNPPLDIEPGAADYEIAAAVRDWIRDVENLWNFAGEYLLPDGRLVTATWGCEEDTDDNCYFDVVEVTIGPAP